MNTKTEFEPLVMTENVRAVTGTEEIDLVYGQTIDQSLADRLGPGKIRSLTLTRQALSQEEFKKFDRARNRNAPADRRFDTPADEATVEAISTPDGKGQSRKIDDRELPPDHPLFGRPRPVVAGGEPLQMPPQQRVPLAGPVTTASERMSQQSTSGSQSGNRPAWHSTPVNELELDDATQHALSQHEGGRLKTAGDILDEGRAHDGLQHIDGIGDGREDAIKKSIEALHKKQGK